MRQGIFDKKELTREALHDILALLFMIWPPPEGENDIEEAIEAYLKDDSLTLNKSILIWDNDVIAGHAEVFQTDVPDFYKRFGCRTIGNGFFNSLDAIHPDKNPWWNEWVMIYPGDFDLGNDKIDLQGKGY